MPTDDQMQRGGACTAQNTAYGESQWCVLFSGMRSFQPAKLFTAPRDRFGNRFNMVAQRAGQTELTAPLLGNNGENWRWIASRTPKKASGVCSPASTSRYRLNLPHRRFTDSFFLAVGTLQRFLPQRWRLIHQQADGEHHPEDIVACLYREAKGV